MANSQELIDVTTRSRRAEIQWLLDKLQEEAAEIIQAVSKIRRFGENNSHPDRKLTNLEELEGEVEDLYAVVLKLEQLKYLNIIPSYVHDKALNL